MHLSIWYVKSAPEISAIRRRNFVSRHLSSGQHTDTPLIERGRGREVLAEPSFLLCLHLLSCNFVGSASFDDGGKSHFSVSSAAPLTLLCFVYAERLCPLRCFIPTRWTEVYHLMPFSTQPGAFCVATAPCIVVTTVMTMPVMHTRTKYGYAEYKKRLAKTNKLLHSTFRMFVVCYNAN